MSNIFSGLPHYTRNDKHTPSLPGMASALTRQSRKLIIYSVLIIFLIITPSFADVLQWNSKEGITRLNNTQYKNDFYQLANRFQPQINPLYCGVASAVIILNTINEDKKIASQKELEITKPQAFGGGIIPFHSYSQLTFLNYDTDKIKDRKIINLQNITKENENNAKNFDPGVTLKELANILKTYQLKVKLAYVKKVDEKSLVGFRKLLETVLIEDQKFLLVNFDGKVLGLKTNGHISPIAAFDETSDSVLVMDVAGHKNGWYWAKVEDMMRAMNSKDGNNYRGYLVVSE